MRVFYHGCAHLPDVPAESPVERNEQEVLVLLNKLRGNGSFLGLELDDCFVLQFMYEQGAIHAEVLNRKSRSLEFCTLSVPLAEDSIRAASRGRPIKTVTEGARIEWRHERLA